MKDLKAQLKEELRRIELKFKNERVLTKCVKNHDGVQMLGDKIGPFKKDKKYKLKFFEALPFIKNDILIIDESERIDNVAVQRHAIAERDNHGLMGKDSKYFLTKIKHFKFFMEKEVLDKLKPQEFLDRFNSFFSNLIDARLLKLLKLAKAKIGAEEERKMTHSEQLIFELLRQIILVWRKSFLE